MIDGTAPYRDGPPHLWPGLVKGDAPSHGHGINRAGTCANEIIVRLKRRRDAWLASVVLVVVLGGVLGACQRNGSTDATTPPPASTPTATIVQPPLELGPVVWTTGIAETTGEPVDRVDSFPRDAVAIHAAVEARSLPAGGSLTAAWEINGQPVEALSTTVAIDRTRRAGWVDFRLDWTGETRWPVGTLTIRISANTGEVVEGTVRIR